MVCEDFTVIDIDPEMQQKQPLAPYELDRKMKTCGNKCSAQFGGPCADVVPTCQICCYERYQKYHANNGSSSVKGIGGEQGSQKVINYSWILVNLRIRRTGRRGWWVQCSWSIAACYANGSLFRTLWRTRVQLFIDGAARIPSWSGEPTSVWKSDGWRMAEDSPFFYIDKSTSKYNKKNTCGLRTRLQNAVLLAERPQCALSGL